MKRPIGVTIIAVLAIIGGILGVLGSLSLLGISGLGFLGGASSSATLASSSMIVGVVGFFGILLAVFQLVVGFGALQLKSWAWTVGVAVYAISLLNQVVSLFTIGATASVVAGVLVAAVILAYLFSHNVREAFGHLPSSTSGTPMVTH